MKAYLFILFLSFFTFHSNAQISASTSKKISKIIGDKFILLPNQNNYPYSFYPNGLNIDMSTSLENDTVGVSYQNEHLLWHDLISFSNQKESLKLISISPVTVQEYIDFQNYVRDSIARDKIYLYESGRKCTYGGHDEYTDLDSKEWINYRDYYWDDKEKKILEFDPSDKELGRSLFYLNWDRPLNYSNPQFMNIYSDLCLPVPERIYNLKEFDQRKLNYRFSNTIRDRYTCGINSTLLKFPFSNVQNIQQYINNEALVIPEQTTILIDNYSWAQSSKNERDEFSVLSHTYTKLFPTALIIGINNPQAKAFCHWKQDKLQKELNKKGIPYKVVLSLPTVEDLKNIQQKEALFTIATKNYTEQWKITNQDYNLFIEAVRDSILRKQLYLKLKSEKEALQLLNYKKLYFDEGTYEYTEIDLSDRLLNTSLFPLNYKTNISSLKIDSSIVDSIKTSDAYVHPRFKHYYIDSKSKGYNGLFESYHDDPELKLYLKYEKNRNYFPEEYLFFSYGKDLNLSFTSLLNQTSSIRSHENFEQFITEDEIVTTPNTSLSKLDPKELIQNITYDQAISYYYWKYPIHNPNPKDNWQNFVLPTKEQFEEIQKGKSIVIEEKQVAYPTPVFRYVVHLYEW